MNVTSTKFESPSRGSLDIEGVVASIVEYLAELPGHPSKIIVGSDSEAREVAVITTVIVVQRIGRGAAYFYTRSARAHYPTMRERIFAEAMSSVTLGQELRTRLREALGGERLADSRIEIHADVGEAGPTRELVAAVIGMLRGYDFTPVIKPDAYAASCVADRHT